MISRLLESGGQVVVTKDRLHLPLVIGHTSPTDEIKRFFVETGDHFETYKLMCSVTVRDVLDGAASWHQIQLTRVIYLPEEAIANVISQQLVDIPGWGQGRIYFSNLGLTEVFEGKRTVCLAEIGSQLVLLLVEVQRTNALNNRPAVEEVHVLAEHLAEFILSPVVPGVTGAPVRLPLTEHDGQELLVSGACRTSLGEQVVLVTVLSQPRNDAPSMVRTRYEWTPAMQQQAGQALGQLLRRANMAKGEAQTIGSDARSILKLTDGRSQAVAEFREEALVKGCVISDDIKVDRIPSIQVVRLDSSENLVINSDCATEGSIDSLEFGVALPNPLAGLRPTSAYVSFYLDTIEGALLSDGPAPFHRNGDLSQLSSSIMVDAIEITRIAEEEARLKSRYLELLTGHVASNWDYYSYAILRSLNHALFRAVVGPDLWAAASVLVANQHDVELCGYRGDQIILRLAPWSCPELADLAQRISERTPRKTYSESGKQAIAGGAPKGKPSDASRRPSKGKR